jgi:hypothetical protein
MCREFLKRMVESGVVEKERRSDKLRKKESLFLLFFSFFLLVFFFFLFLKERRCTQFAESGCVHVSPSHALISLTILSKFQLVLCFPCLNSVRRYTQQDYVAGHEQLN